MQVLNFVKILLLGAELWTKKRKDITKLIFACRDFAKAPAVTSAIKFTTKIFITSGLIFGMWLNLPLSDVDFCQKFS